MRTPQREPLRSGHSLHEVYVAGRTARNSARWRKRSTSSRPWWAGRVRARRARFRFQKTSRPFLSSFPLISSPTYRPVAAGLMVEQPAINTQHNSLAFISEGSRPGSRGVPLSLSSFKPQVVSAVQDLPQLPFGKTSPWQLVGPTAAKLRTAHDCRRLPDRLESSPAWIVHGGPTVSSSRLARRSREPTPRVFALQVYAVLRLQLSGDRAATAKSFAYANYNDRAGAIIATSSARRFAYLTGNRRPRTAWRHGLELRRLHDLLDHHADERFKAPRRGRR